MKKLLLFCLFVVMSISVKAQLADGSIAPDFTLQDLNGNTWHLYELLDQGKSVVLDFSATWCGPCWTYHTSGALESLYDTYGPGGTNEFMVFMIEGDPSTNLECIYDLPGCNSSSQGDWTAGTLYPIINDDFIASEYSINYWPTLYYVCPNRLVTELPQPPANEIYALKDDCAIAFGENNASILKYTGFAGAFCVSETITPMLKIQNLGNSPLVSATAEFWLNGILQETVDWTGDISTYSIVYIEFSNVTVTEDATLEFNLTSVNGTTDDDIANNQVVAEAIEVVPTDQNYLQLELRTDPFPGETYWEVKNDDGKVLYKGGNPRVLDLADDGGTYTQGETSYFIDIPLSGDGCFKFSIYDSFGDGICCAEGFGYYKITDLGGNVVLEGGSFEYEEHKPFGIANAVSPIPVNGSISGYNGPAGEFCGSLDYAPVIGLLNLGDDTITTAEIELVEGEEVLTTTLWTGNILKGQSGEISLQGVTFTSGTDDLQIRIKTINGVADNFDYHNTYAVDLAQNYTEEYDFVMELQVDQYAFELYWQLTNSAGEVIYSGGNPLVGPDGGGSGNGTAGDPGAYAANQLIIEQITLPNDVNDCYTFLIVDDYGDGMVDGGGGYVSFTESNLGNEVVNVDYSSVFFTTKETLLDVNPVQSAVPHITTIDRFLVYPNPAQQEINLDFTMSKNIPLRISVYNMLGEVVQAVPEKQYPEGSSMVKLDVSDLTNGVYYVNMASGNGQFSRKFTIVR